MSTPATGLRRIGRIDFHELTPSFFRFGTQLREKGQPCRVTNRLGKAMGMQHPVHVQIFYADEAEAINNLTRLLMSEILPFELGTLMDSCNNLAMLHR